MLATGLLVVSTGCVYRSLTIRTEPPGAKVYVNDVLKGESPVTYDFTWYGWHRVTIRKDGFQRLDDRKMLRAPAYLWIPLDLVTELLPLRMRDERTWSYTLTPATEPPTPVPPERLSLSAPSPAQTTSTSIPIQAEVAHAEERSDEPR